jgi:uncharacterized protein YcbX
MSSAVQLAGSVTALWRFPVKSMMGEELNAVDVSSSGLLGDRAYALVDQADGKIVSAKNPHKWPRLFDCRAAFVEPPRAGRSLPPVRITLPDGTMVASDQQDLGPLLSEVLGRQVALDFRAPDHPTLEEYWPDLAELDRRDVVTDESLPPGTFFDCATVHLLTTATLDRLRQAYPQGRVEVRRFRPNIVVTPPPGAEGFVENAWIGHTLAIGEQVRLSVTGPCPRCVMTTLAQGDLPRDPGILRAAAQQNAARIGVYAAVVRGGTIRRGDPVRLDA